MRWTGKVMGVAIMGVLVLCISGPAARGVLATGGPEAGLKDGPWLLEYGFAGSPTEWDYAVALLIGEGIAEDAIHVPGTIPPYGIRFTRALALAEYINGNDLQDVRVIGHSLGGIDAAYLVEVGYLLDDNEAIPDFLEIPQGGLLAEQKAEFINAYRKIKAIYTLHSPFMGSHVEYRRVADLVEEFVNYGSGRYRNGCCKDPYEHSLCWFLRNPDDGLVYYGDMYLYSDCQIVHKYWIGSREICHSEARLVPDYFLDIIYEEG